MSISDELTRIQGAKASLKTSITNKGVEVPDTALIDAYPALVDQIQTGGGSTGDDVVFVDYDGTELHTYSKDDFLKLTSLPDNPDRTAENLTAEGWNWSLADAQAYVEEYGKLTIGQTYHTTDGINYFYLAFGSETKITLLWSQTVENGVVVDWGDGSATETSSGTGAVTLEHTYAGPSEPVLTMQSVAGNTLTLGVNNNNIFNTTNGNNYLKTVYLANGVELGGGAFRYCYALTSITIPSSVTRISSFAFCYCYALASITIPSSVTSINGYAFQYCYALASITIPNSVTIIGGDAFYYCQALTSITIPNSVTIIGGDAFYYCQALTSITIPNSVTNIYEYAFQDCHALTSITIPNSVTSISNYAFRSCYALTSITIPNSVTSIGSRAFQDCHALTSITIPNSVTNIYEYAFQYCYALTSITIPNSVTSISNYAFRSCYALTSITIPNSVTSIGSDAFQDCNANLTIDLSSATKVPTASGDIFGGTANHPTILVPSALLSDFQSATNWSTYANFMKGV